MYVYRDDKLPAARLGRELKRQRESTNVTAAAVRDGHTKLMDMQPEEDPVAGQKLKLSPGDAPCARLIDITRLALPRYVDSIKDASRAIISSV